MTFLAPLGLFALGTLAVIYLIHLLRGSRRRVMVPAAFLWANLPRASSGRTQRRRPPFTLLLLLQLVAAALAALALARPAAPSDPPRHVALILDASGSMQATDVSPSRFEAARAAALERVGDLRPQDLVSVIRAGSSAALLTTGTPDAARQALNGIKTGVTKPAVREALALGSTVIRATPERQGQIVLLTDAAGPPPESVGPLAAPVEVVTVGGGSNNQAVETAVVRMDPSGQSQTAFVQLANWADHPVRVPVRLSGDGAPLDERQVDIAARSRTSLSVPIPVDVRRLKVELVGQDALALDDVAEVLTQGGPPRDVVLGGRMSPDLQRALESMPFVRLHVGDAWPQPALTVLDGTLPPQLPPGPLLLVDPPSDSARLLGVGLGSGARAQLAHPLLQGLDVAALQRESPSVGGVPGWARVVLGTVQGPLVMEGKLDAHPTVALTFDPSLSGMQKSLAFPLLISNASSYLLAQADGAGGVTDSFDAAESDIAPRQPPTFEQAAVADPTSGLLERWPWFAGAMLVVLGLEWLVFARRG